MHMDEHGCPKPEGERSEPSGCRAPTSQGFAPLTLGLGEDVTRRLGILVAISALIGGALLASSRSTWLPRSAAQEIAVPPDLMRQTASEATAKSAGCIHCHQNSHDPHFKDTLNLGCCDCHGGDPTSLQKEIAHVAPRFHDAWKSSANP